jgi:hypothetical protein
MAKPLRASPRYSGSHPDPHTGATAGDESSQQRSAGGHNAAWARCGNLRVINPASSKNPRFVIRPEYRDACQARLIPLEDNDFSVARLDHHAYRIAHPHVHQLPPLDNVVNGRRANSKRRGRFPDGHQIDLSCTPQVSGFLVTKPWNSESFCCCM